MKKAARILLVDDEAPILTALEFLLTREGYQIEKAGNGKVALDKFSDFDPDLILLDVMMPEMNGFETALQLRQRFPEKDCRIIFLTAKGMKEDRQQGFLSGAEEYIIKPFDNDELLTIIKENLAEIL